MQLATIGYEGAAIADFVRTLVTAGVERAIDVREIAQSRRPGFSKKALQTALAEAGIDYHHLRQLGDPKSGREAARSGNMPLFEAIFRTHMEQPASRVALTEATSLAKERDSVLICYERDPRHCHRKVVAERMAADGVLKIVHLGVRASERRRVGADVVSADRLAGAY